MQSYEDLETLSLAYRNTIDFIVKGNRTLRGEVADASGFIRETINLRCLNEPGRVEKISVFVTASLRALVTESEPTGWLDAALTEIAQRVRPEAPDLALGSIEVIPAQLVDDAPFEEPPRVIVGGDIAPEDIVNKPGKVESLDADAEAYILALQAQLRAYGLDPLTRGTDYAYELTQRLALEAKQIEAAKQAPPGPPTPDPVLVVQHIDGVSEV